MLQMMPRKQRRQRRSMKMKRTAITMMNPDVKRPMIMVIMVDDGRKGHG